MTALPGPRCPMPGDGRHKVKPWATSPGEPVRSGFACVACSKTWQWVDGDVVSSYDLRQATPRGLP